MLEKNVDVNGLFDVFTEVSQYSYYGGGEIFKNRI